VLFVSRCCKLLSDLDCLLFIAVRLDAVPRLLLHPDWGGVVVVVVLNYGLGLLDLLCVARLLFLFLLPGLRRLLIVFLWWLLSARVRLVSLNSKA